MLAWITWIAWKGKRELAGQVELYVPRLEELWFRQKMMSDPDTMSYNAGWEVNFTGYHRETGCIDFPEDGWADWYSEWKGREPERFYAYIRRSADGAWMGEVNFHFNREKDWWDMGIVIFAPFRGMGYAVPSLKQMLDHAFHACHVSRIHNDFQVARNEVSAWEAHRRAGFREMGVEDGFLHVMITREDYLEGRMRNSKQHIPVQYPERDFWEPCGQKSLSKVNGYWKGVCGTYKSAYPRNSAGRGFWEPCGQKLLPRWGRCVGDMRNSK